MKIVISSVAAIGVMLLLQMANAILLKYAIPDFAIGWLSCMAYYVCIDVYDEFTNHK
jgi:hypothetical protein